MKRTFNGHANGLSKLIVLQTGDLASLSADTIKICNPIDGTSNKTLNPNDSVFALTVLQNGDWASGSFEMKIWNPIDGKFKRTLSVQPQSSYVWALTVLQNGD